MSSAGDFSREPRIGSGLADQTEGSAVECRNAAGLSQTDIEQLAIAAHRHSYDDRALLGGDVANELLMLREDASDLPQIVILGFALAILAGRVGQGRWLRRSLGIAWRALLAPASWWST